MVLFKSYIHKNCKTSSIVSGDLMSINFRIRLLVYFFIFNIILIEPFYAQKHSATSAYTTYKGLVMTGYQGWFGTPGDGATNSWRHYNNSNGFEPGASSIEYWPDMREADEDEKALTPFVKSDGSPAYVFSSANQKTVNRHYRWMKEYGIDGAFQQRFRSDFGMRSTLNKVLANSLEGARNNGRAIAIMYDISGNVYAAGHEKEKVDSVRTDRVQSIADDFKFLVDSLRLTTGGDDQPYLYHNGKPLIALWGFGFPHRHGYSNGLDVQFWEELMDFFQNDPEYGGCSIMFGVPTYWRVGGGDCIWGVKHNEMLKVLQRADIIMPWHTSRFERANMFDDFYNILEDDVTWGKYYNVDVVPTISPGIREKIINNNGYEKKREGGYYFWDMTRAALEAGAEMLYLGMFDEVDEGTQFCKIDNDPPLNAGAEPFGTYEGDPPDHYLWLGGEAKRALNGEFEIETTFRTRADKDDFLSKVDFIDNDNGFEMALTSSAIGRKIFFADPYKVPDGAPTLNVKRDSELFKTELTEAKIQFGNENKELYFRFVEVDENDNVLSYYAVKPINNPTTDIRESTNIPSTFMLYQNTPNPFNPATKIKYSMMKSGYVTLEVYDTLGKIVEKLVDRYQTANDYEVKFISSGLSSGVYFYKLMIDENLIDIKKMILLK